MNLNRRVEKLENKLRPGNGVIAIRLGKDESSEQALNRYCSENNITAGELDHHNSLKVFLRTDFGD